MSARCRILLFALAACACVDAEDIDTNLQRDPARGSVRVVSLLADDPVDLTVTLEDEAPVSFAGLMIGVTSWRPQVAGDATAWVLRDGHTLASSDHALLANAQATVLVIQGDPAPRLAWLNEDFTGDAASAHVRFVNGLPSQTVSATLEGHALGGTLDPASASGWADVAPVSEATLVVSDGVTTFHYDAVDTAADAFVTFAIFPGPPAAPPRVLMFDESGTSAPLSLDARATP